MLENVELLDKKMKKTIISFDSQDFIKGLRFTSTATCKKSTNCRDAFKSVALGINDSGNHSGAVLTGTNAFLLKKYNLNAIVTTKKAFSVTFNKEQVKAITKSLHTLGKKCDLVLNYIEGSDNNPIVSALIVGSNGTRIELNKVCAYPKMDDSLIASLEAEYSLSPCYKVSELRKGLKECLKKSKFCHQNSKVSCFFVGGSETEWTYNTKLLVKAIDQFNGKTYIRLYFHKNILRPLLIKSASSIDKQRVSILCPVKYKKAAKI